MLDRSAVFRSIGGEHGLGRSRIATYRWDAPLQWPTAQFKPCGDHLGTRSSKTLCGSEYTCASERCAVILSNLFALCSAEQLGHARKVGQGCPRGNVCMNG